MLSIHGSREPYVVLHIIIYKVNVYNTIQLLEVRSMPMDGVAVTVVTSARAYKRNSHIVSNKPRFQGTENIG